MRGLAQQRSGIARLALCSSVALALPIAAGGGCEEASVNRPAPGDDDDGDGADSPSQPRDAAPPEDAPPRPDLWSGFDPTLARDGAPEAAAAACPGTEGPAPASCASVGVIVDPHYAARYTCFDLGPVPGLPAQKYGGLTLTQEPCSTTLLIGGAANEPGGKLYSIKVRRDRDGHIAGFEGSATVFADAPYNDGGVAYAPGGVLLLTRWPSNELQQTKPGSTQADKEIDLGAIGVAHASASLNFVPASLPGGGALKLVSWSGGQWYTLKIAPDGQGTFDVTGATQALALPGGPEGFVYVAAGSPLFPAHSLLVSEWTANEIATYEIDERADPKLDTRRDFITGLKGAEGAYRDPATGDFFFSTWGQDADRVIVVRGFRPIID